MPKDKLSFFENIDLTNTLIRTSRVNKNYISKKLNINIEEREPYAIWCQSSPLVLQAVNIEVATSTEVATSSVGNISDSHVGVPDVCYWFDKDGFMFAEAPETEGVLIRSVHDVSGREIQTGNYILPNEQKNMLFKILEFVDAAGIKVKYFQLEPIEKQEVTAVSAAGPAIYFSLRLDPAFALEPVRTLVPTLPGLKYVDLRSENKVFYK